MHEIVLDTNVLVAALRSRRGASYQIVSLIGTGAFRSCVSVALALEYEEILKRSDLLAVQCGGSIVTYNKKDFVGAGKRRVVVLTPAEFLDLIRQTE